MRKKVRNGKIVCLSQEGVKQGMVNSSQEQARSYREGMIVDVATKVEWGPGKIVHISGNHLHIIFRHLEERVARVFSDGAPSLRVAMLQSDPTLDNLPPLIEKDGRWHHPAPRISFASAERKFLHHFPAGFSDPRYLEGERKEKDEAHNRFGERLGLEEFREQLANADIASITAKGLSVLSAVNFLLSPFEIAAFHDAMRDASAARTFFSALLRVIESTQITAEVFETYLDAVWSLPAKRGRVASWPVATVFPHIAQPNDTCFLNQK